MAGAPNRPAPYVLPRRRIGNLHAIATRIERDELPKKLLLGGREMFIIGNHPTANLNSPESYLTAMYRTFGLSNEVIDRIWRTTTDADGNKIPDKRAFVPTGPPVGTKEISSVANSIMGYIVVAHLVKAITPDNLSYIHRRFTTVGAEMDDPVLRVLQLGDIERLIHMNPLNEARDFILRQQADRMILEDVLAWEAMPGLQETIKSSLKIVISGYGMTGTKHMRDFCRTVTKAHIYEVVLKECLAFKDAYEEFVNIHGEENALLGRVLKIQGVNALDSTKFPHLYVCAMAKSRGVTSAQLAAGTISTKLGKYKSSNMTNLTMSTHALETAALSTLTTDLIVTQVIADDVMRLNQHDLSSQIGQPIQ